MMEVENIGRMEGWKNGILRGIMLLKGKELNRTMTERDDAGGPARRNINRGFKKLRVWQDAVSLYSLACKIFLKFPFGLRKPASNAIDAAHSISRNIAEGYCRRSLKEYLNLLNIALGSCGEFHSCYESFWGAGQISHQEYGELDELHYKVENGLIGLIRALQKKQRTGHWEEEFQE